MLPHSLGRDQWKCTVSRMCRSLRALRASTPPNTSIFTPTRQAEWPERGLGGLPLKEGLSHTGAPASEARAAPPAPAAEAAAAAAVLLPPLCSRGSLDTALALRPLKSSANKSLKQLLPWPSPPPKTSMQLFLAVATAEWPERGLGGLPRASTLLHCSCTPPAAAPAAAEGAGGCCARSRAQQSWKSLLPSLPPKSTSLLPCSSTAL